jgi:plastocyanin
MVTFVASLIGAAAVFAGVTSAVPMEYGDMSSSAPPAKMTSGYDKGYGSGDKGYGSGDKGYGSGDKSWSSSAEPPSYTMGSDSGKYGDKSPSYSPSSYGSGSSNWNNGEYDSCVQQCVAQFGSPSSMYMPPTSTSEGSGNGKTHTVIVAPTKGVFRYVPFAVNASVGDTVKFIWGADNHTVSKSSQLSLCNKTDQPFLSGEQNKTFVFTQVVNDTNPTFYYCGTPTHCQKGMFGIINPPNAYMQPGSVAMMMPSLAEKYPSTGAAMSYTNNVTANETAAANWGMSMNMSGMPEWAESYAAENVLYTRSFLAMNPETLKSDGTVDFSSLGTSAVMLPIDVASMSSNNADGSYGSPAASSTSPAASSPSSSAIGGSSNASSNGAGVLSSPRVAVALVAVVAAFFAL